jgi:adenylosuccinate synthase
MSAVVIIGAQWGDEGKGKIVDLLAESADVVVRYAGGPNAGHTLVVGDDKVVFRLVPSGVLHPHTQCVLGQGMVVNPRVLLEEIDELERRKISVTGRLHVSEQVHLILPHHIEMDGLRESSASGTKIGTTKRGIGPCYEDKIGRRGLRAADLRDAKTVQRKVEEALASWAPLAKALGGELPEASAVCDELAEQAKRLVPLLTDTSLVLERALDAQKRVMLEGAQGTLLDIDHGTYPFVTSSSAVAGGACTGAGIGPTRLGKVVGITKAYATRVGAGPFPTEQDNDVGKHLRDVGQEYGSVTKRPRRTGWLDLPALRYARRVNGLGALTVTKLDVLTGLEELSVCVGYRIDGEETSELPLTRIDRAEPIYETMPGWTEDITGCRSMSEMPENATNYLQRIEDETRVPLHLVSTGPRREQTIVLREVF